MDQRAIDAVTMPIWRMQLVSGPAAPELSGQVQAIVDAHRRL